MKERKFRVLAIFLVCSFLMAGCSKTEESAKKTKKSEDKEYEKHEMETKDPDDETTDTEETTEPSQRDTSARSAPTPSPTPEVIPHLTEQDIQDMNGGNALIIRNDQGNVSTIVGRYFYRPVTDEEDAISAVEGLQELLGIEKGYFPFAMYGETFQGYTYYTYRQIKGDLTVQNATLKVVLDPEGYPCMLQSSLETTLDVDTPNAKIDEADAEQIVLNRVGSGYQIFSEYTMKTCFVDDYHETRHCFEVITNNPNGNISFDMPYIIHFVDYDGSYVKSYPTSYLPTDQLADYGNESYFKDLEASEHTFTVNRNGSDFTFSVPISYNSVDGKYYLADPERHIICADFYEFEYNGHNLVFESSDNPDSWSENHVITYYNYIQSYDFYKIFNVYSTDGFGMPMLILMGYCEQDGTPVNNACNMGVVDGWSLFGASDANTYCYSLDVCAHEFTHGVSGFARQGNIYANEYGAINEAFSDIMGNICEMYMGETWDTDWLLAETSGNTMRCMSNPYMYNQPMYLADPYYQPISNQGMLYGMQDNGGVHINNTLISYLCYKMYLNGMSLYDLAHFFLCAMEMHTPTADYDDLYGIFVAAAYLSGNESAIPLITQHWQDTLLVGDRSKNTENCAINGYQRINVPFATQDLASRTVVYVVSASSGNVVQMMFAQPDGVASILMPADDNQYFFVVEEYSDDNYSSLVAQKALDNAMSGWTTDNNSIGYYYMESGDVATVPAYS